MQELLDQEIQLIPDTIDSYMCEGTALQWFQAVDNNAIYNWTQHNFGRADGSAEGKIMCHTTMTDDHLCGVFRKANQAWLRT
eukprot:12404720-Ditylum_brightwellii.AAC.1